MISGHTWTGNIRELENVIHHALLVGHGNTVRPEDLNLASLRPRASSLATAGSENFTGEVRLREALLALFAEEPEKLHELIENTVMRTAFDYC